ncbi:unnamed protein product [Thelazia callipaeda]|uniref:Transposase n=1 Tax=Thelazia callipaeda TaxID=103827 RepID=A0A0N5CST1_THECL|nr:unnamed protein product [Thelazia callipaeda]
MRVRTAIRVKADRPDILTLSGIVADFHNRYAKEICVFNRMEAYIYPIGSTQENARKHLISYILD